MSCETNSHKVTVLGDLDVRERSGRHRRDDDGRDFDSLRDLLKSNQDGEAHRDIVKEILEAKFANVRETLESKAAVLKAIAEAAAEVKEAKHDIQVKQLEGQIEFQKALRELMCRPRERGNHCGNHD